MGILDSLSTTNWTPFGPAPIDAPGVGLGLAAGRIEAAAPDLTDVNAMYIVGNNGGVWMTSVWTNKPPIWVALGDAQESMQIGGYHPLAVHPANHNLVFCVASFHGAGLLKSTNGGLSWSLFGNALFEGAAISTLAVDPADTNVFYVGVGYGGPGGGLYKSIDGGQNWTHTTSFHPGGVADMIVARFDGHTLYAGLVGGAGTAGVYKSTKGPNTETGDWQLLTGLPSGTGLGNAVRLDSASTAGVAYISYFIGSSQNTTIARARTSDGGQTWKPLIATPGSTETRGWHLLLGVDPKNDKHVFANAAYALYESVDGGQTWTRADMAGGKAIGDDWVNINFDAEGWVVVTADRNVYRYDPKNKAWQSKEGNLQVTLFYDVALDPADLNIAYGVAQDHPAAMKFDGSTKWAYMEWAGGETGRVVVDASQTTRLYVSNPLDPTHFVARSTDSAQSWETIYVTNDFVAGDYSLAYSIQKSFVVDPSDPKRLLIGTTKVFETKDATILHPTWSALSGVLGSGGNVGLQYITALAIAPSDSKTIYAATADGHVWVTKDGGSSWPQRDTGFYGAGGGKIVDIRIDPKNPDRAFAVGTGEDSVWYLDSVAGSLQWTNISGDLPTYLRFVTIFPNWGFATPALYLGTTRGVYHSVTLGAHWEAFGLDMPNTVVSGLESVAHDVLVAATTGRGAWAILTKASIILGTITQPLFKPDVHPGDPVEGMVVVLEPIGGARRHGLSATTDARGRYAFENVPPGTYTVHRIAPPGYVATDDSIKQITVNGSAVRNLDFHYRFSPELARARELYSSVGDLIALPGRQAGEPIGAKDEHERPG